jgi:homoserine O-acetyltransferase
MESKHRQVFEERKPFSLTLGGRLSGFSVAYETWGELDEDKSNAVLLFTGLSASAHAKSHGKEDGPGWWEAMIGPGAAIDTRRFFVICFNHLGGCFGSTGPSSINPDTGKRYGPEFPPLMLHDLARAVERAVCDLGVRRVYCSMGASMGGMLAMEYCARYPDSVDRMLMISASGRPGPVSIAFRYVQRQVILGDPYFADGWYYDQENKPTRSMAVARQLGNITYRSRQEFQERFGRSRTGEGYSLGPDFQVESYLHHMGNKLANNFDPNSFLVLSKSMDLYSLGYGFPTYEQGVARIIAKSLIIGVNTDMLFPWEEQEDVYKTLKRLGRDVRFELLKSYSGHDAFLVEVDYFSKQIGEFLAE